MKILTKLLAFLSCLVSGMVIGWSAMFLIEGIKAKTPIGDDKMFLCLCGIVGSLFTIWLSISLIRNVQYGKVMKFILLMGSNVVLIFSILLFMLSSSLYGMGSRGDPLSFWGMVGMIGAVIVFLAFLIYIITQIPKKTPV